MQRTRVLLALLVAATLLAPTSAQQTRQPPPYRILVSNDDGVNAPGIAASICGNRQTSKQPAASGSFNTYAEPVEIVALQNDCGEMGFVIDRGNTKKKKKRAN